MNTTAARNQAEKLVEDLRIVRPPVDVEDVARRLQLRIAKENLGKDVAGLLITTPYDRLIVVQRSDPPTRQRFTIAHEIGHHYLKHHFPEGVVHVDKGNFISRRSSHSSTGVDPAEIEANQFAAALLMPTAFLERRIQELGISPLWDRHVEELAEEFYVSGQAMTIRLTRLGYL